MSVRVRNELLSWVQTRTQKYKHVNVQNFTDSWADGMAFCALLHSLYPDLVPYDTLKPENKTENLKLAFEIAGKLGISNKLDPKDMLADKFAVIMYLSQFFQRFKAASDFQLRSISDAKQDINKAQVVEEIVKLHISNLNVVETNKVLEANELCRLAHEGNQDIIVREGGIEALVQCFAQFNKEQDKQITTALESALLALSKSYETRVMDTIKKANILTLLAGMERLCGNKGLLLLTSDECAPWYVEPLLLPADRSIKYSIISAKQTDKDFVMELYNKCPVPGYDVKSVRIIHNEQLESLFSEKIEALENRYNKPEFTAKWEEESSTLEELDQRHKITKLFRSIAKPYSFKKTPHVSFLPLWHSTDMTILESLFFTGYPNFSENDTGLFGTGIYMSVEAEYAHRLHNSGTLVLNWVAIFSPFPVIFHDEEKLHQSQSFQNYDAHFAPVFSSSHPQTTSYHACKHNQKHNYIEVVAFDISQVLPHYIVELQRNPTNNTPLSPCISPSPSPTPSPGRSPARSRSNSLTSPPISLIYPISPDVSIVPMKSVSEWSVEDVCSWCASLSLSKDYRPLLQKHNINGIVLQSMKKEDWSEIGINAFGDVRILTMKSAKLQ